MKPPTTPSFELFYDAQCPLCRREIEMVRRLDKHQQLILTDISSQEFEVEETGQTLDSLMREIHGRYADGSWVTGVEAFREVYDRIGFRKLVGPTRWPIIRHALTFGYKIFARLRYFTAVRRMKHQLEKQTDCKQTCSPLDQKGSVE